MIRRTFLALGASALLAVGCSASSVDVPEAAGVPPPLIPIEAFFYNRETNYGYKISPDGTRLGWIASAGGRLTVHWKRLGADEIGIVDTGSRRSLQSFEWAPDSRRVLYGQDRDGDENTHIFIADTEQPGATPRDLTPFAGQRAFIQQTIRGGADYVLVGVNRSRTALADLYRVALATGERTRVAENPGDVLSWITDVDGVVRARIRRPAPEERVLERPAASGESWERIIAMDLEEYAWPVGFTADRTGLWLRTNHRRDRYALVRLDLRSGRQTVAYEHPVVDVEGARVSARTGEPLLAVSVPGYPHARFFDRNLEVDLAALRGRGPSGIRLLSLDDSEQLATVQVYRDRSDEFYLVNRRTRERTLLGRSAIAPYAEQLAAIEPISLKSRDGLTLHGYLARPRGGGAPAPLVLLVHGGPWFRDYWGYDSTVQFLTNRGYAVLRINYRASTGYGRAFVEAGVRQHSRAMHDDLIDGVRWAIAKGIADPRRVAIMGASYGGYATLVGLTFTPEVFACGVDFFGPSNLVSLLEARPAYWTWSFFQPYYRKYYGEVTQPDDRRRLESQSPLFRADRVQRPLLVIHGANDPNVRKQESDQMVEALRREGKDVEYFVLYDEGHGGFGNPTSVVRTYRVVEGFLARHLGGRSGS
jgi:dipeptidyl aminopeptidase/acylaminoacyl peptidase